MTPYDLVSPRPSKTKPSKLTNFQVRVKIEGDNEPAPTIPREEGQVPFVFVGTVESISNAKVLLEYHLAHLKEVEALRQEKLEIDQQLRSIHGTNTGPMQSFQHTRRGMGGGPGMGGPDDNTGSRGGRGGQSRGGGRGGGGGRGRAPTRHNSGKYCVFFFWHACMEDWRIVGTGNLIQSGVDGAYINKKISQIFDTNLSFFIYFFKAKHYISCNITVL